MAKQEISRLNETLNHDVALRERLQATTNADQMVRVARAAGYDFTVDELKEAMRSQPVPMTEDQLQRVAGGSLNFASCDGSVLPAVFYKVTFSRTY
jgi:predicted ribosomally synthesized peptide with nif11-like leader